MPTDETKSNDGAVSSGDIKAGEGNNNTELKIPELPRNEVSAQAVARMMGVATNTEIKLLEGKLDLISSRISNMTVRLEKVVSQFNQLPSGSDLERIDVQIGSLKTMIRDFLTGKSTAQDGKSSAQLKDKKQSTTVVTADSSNISHNSDEVESEEGQEVRS